MKPYELAKMKGVTVQTIYRWIREGVIPKKSVHTKTVERIEIDDDIIQYLERKNTQ